MDMSSAGYDRYPSFVSFEKPVRMLEGMQELPRGVRNVRDVINFVTTGLSFSPQDNKEATWFTVNLVSNGNSLQDSPFPTESDFYLKVSVFKDYVIVGMSTIKGELATAVSKSGAAANWSRVTPDVRMHNSKDKVDLTDLNRLTKNPNGVTEYFSSSEVIGAPFTGLVSHFTMETKWTNDNIFTQRIHTLDQGNLGTEYTRVVSESGAGSAKRSFTAGWTLTNNPGKSYMQTTGGVSESVSGNKVFENTVTFTGEVLSLDGIKSMGTLEGNTSGAVINKEMSKLGFDKLVDIVKAQISANASRSSTQEYYIHNIRVARDAPRGVEGFGFMTVRTTPEGIAMVELLSSTGVSVHSMFSQDYSSLNWEDK